MKGSQTKKLGRLFAFLASHPNQIPRYLRQSLLGTSPIQLELPWISNAAIDRLENILQNHHTVAEFGGGGSTLFFSKRCKSVLCIESSAEWAQEIQTVIEKGNILNVRMEILPYSVESLDDYKASANLHCIDDASFDVILIDAYEEKVEFRPTCFYHAEKHINPGGVIIVDDSWRYPELNGNHHAKKREEFMSTGPCRPGVTSTDIYYY